MVREDVDEFGTREPAGRQPRGILLVPGQGVAVHRLAVRDREVHDGIGSAEVEPAALRFDHIPLHLVPGREQVEAGPGNIRVPRFLGEGGGPDGRAHQRSAHGLVVDDRADTGGIREEDTDARIREDHRKGLVPFTRRVRRNGDGHHFGNRREAVGALHEREPARGGRCEEITAAARAHGSHGVVEAHGARRPFGESDGERDGAPTRVAFHDRSVADATVDSGGHRVVVPDRAQPGPANDRGSGRIGELDGEGLVRFDDDIGQDLDDDAFITGVRLEAPVRNRKVRVVPRAVSTSTPAVAVPATIRYCTETSLVAGWSNVTAKERVRAVLVPSVIVASPTAIWGTTIACAVSAASDPNGITLRMVATSPTAIRRRTVTVGTSGV